jgi:hypothetical protein
MELVRELLLDSTPQGILLVALCKASLVLAVAQLFVNGAASLSAATKHLILTLSLVAFAAIPGVALFGPEWRVRVATPAVVPQTRAAVQTFEQVAAGEEEGWHPTDVLPFVWAAGAVTLFLRLGRSAMRLRRT